MIPPEMFPAFDKALIDGGDVSMEFGLDLWRVELEVWARLRLNTGAEVIQAEASGPTLMRPIWLPTRSSRKN